MNQIENLFSTISNIVTDEIKNVKLSSFGEKELSNISINHLYYMDAVCAIEQPTVSSIAAFMKVTKPSATIMVNKLINQGYLYKVQSNEDKRIFYIYLSEKGKMLADAEKTAYRNVSERLAAGLNEKELEQLENLAVKIIKNLSAE